MRTLLQSCHFQSDSSPAAHAGRTTLADELKAVATVGSFSFVLKKKRTKTSYRPRTQERCESQPEVASPEPKWCCPEEAKLAPEAKINQANHYSNTRMWFHQFLNMLGNESPWTTTCAASGIPKYKQSIARFGLWWVVRSTRITIPLSQLPLPVSIICWIVCSRLLAEKWNF